jgi:hypothetical protein
MNQTNLQLHSAFEETSEDVISIKLSALLRISNNKQNNSTLVAQA